MIRTVVFLMGLIAASNALALTEDQELIARRMAEVETARNYCPGLVISRAQIWSHLRQNHIDPHSDEYLIHFHRANGYARNSLRDHSEGSLCRTTLKMYGPNGGIAPGFVRKKVQR